MSHGRAQARADVYVQRALLVVRDVKSANNCRMKHDLSMHRNLPSRAVPATEESWCELEPMTVEN